MGYGHRLRVQRSADARVLKAQLDLIAEMVHAGRFIAPLLAAAIAWLGSSEFGFFGNEPLVICLALPLAVGATTALSSYFVSLYRGDTDASTSEALLQPWFARFVSVQIAISASWSLLPWIMWVSGNSLNHLFLAAGVCCVLGWLAISRANHMDMFMASLAPLVALSSLRFLLDGETLSIGIAIALPVFAGLLFSQGLRLTQRLEQDSRLRFEVEDLARDVGVARDEALRKRFEAEAANASKTAFLANMSHELRTPLNAILGFSEIIAQECFGAIGSPRYKEYAGDIHSSGAHLLSLINDLLDVAKIEAGRMEIEPNPLDVRKSFESSLKFIAPKARERRQKLLIEVSDDAPPLYADERALKQILINLVSNAVKFTPEGGQISVTGTRAACGSFLILVEDNGPGIPREKLDRIFKPFSQVDNRYDRQAGGTGLGLALVRGLAELHGGRAWLESDVGMGCRAHVLLPIPSAEALAEAERNAGMIAIAAA